MFVGHLAVALAARRAERRAPLGALVGAAFALDLVWPLFLLAGIETVRIDPGNTAFTPLAFASYPWSHSLSMAVVWSVVAGRVAAAILKRARAGLFIGLAVLSHWLLDFVTHRPDLPLWPGGPLVGLGLWNSLPLTLVVEGVLFAAAVALYLRATRPRDAVGRWALWGLVLLDDGNLDQRPVLTATAQRHGGCARDASAVAASVLGAVDRTASHRPLSIAPPMWRSNTPDHRVPVPRSSA